MCTGINFKKTSFLCVAMLLMAAQAIAQSNQTFNNIIVQGTSVLTKNVQVRPGAQFYVMNNTNGTTFMVENSNKITIGTVPSNVGLEIIGNTIMAQTDAAVAKWRALPASTKNLWGLWLESGVVATDFAISSPTAWADFVFEKDYKLPTLKEVENFIAANKHLPNMPSAQKVKEEGYTLHDINTKFLQKIEELTLYSIEQDKQINALQQQLSNLEQRLTTLEQKKGKRY